MKIYLLTQNENAGYDTYDSCVVIAENEEEEKKIRPDGGSWERELKNKYCCWVNHIERVSIEYIGEAKEESEEEVICSSFNAG